MAAARAVAQLEQDGYSVAFRLLGGDVSGMARYQSSGAYALQFAHDDGAETEYILLDPILFRRVTPSVGLPSAWEWTLWHADIPIPSLTEYHPRLPLELLRAAEDWRDAGVGADGARRLEGTVHYLAALFACYEDTPSLAQQRGPLGTARWPLVLELDPANGLPRAISLEIPAGAGEGTAPTTLVYRDFQTGPRLAPPPDAIEGDSHLVVRDAPSGEVSALPLVLQGEGTQIRPPAFRARAGTLSLRLSPGQSDVQVALWRIKRGRLLLSSLATTLQIGGAGDVELAFPVVPGDYIVEVELPEPAVWTLALDDGGAVPPTAPASNRREGDFDDHYYRLLAPGTARRAGLALGAP